MVIFRCSSDAADSYLSCSTLPHRNTATTTTSPQQRYTTTITPQRYTTTTTPTQIYTTTTTPPLKCGKEIPFTDSESYLTITPNPPGRCQGTMLPSNGCQGTTLPSNGSRSDHVDGRVANRVGMSRESESESSDDDETGELIQRLKVPVNFLRNGGFIFSGFH